LLFNCFHKKAEIFNLPRKKNGSRLLRESRNTQTFNPKEGLPALVISQTGSQRHRYAHKRNA